MKCSVCGSELPDNSKFCIFCGSTLKAAAPVAPAEPKVPAYTPPSYTPPAPSTQGPYAPPVYQSQTSLYQQPTYTPPVAPGEEVVVPAKPVRKGKKAKKGSKKGLLIASVVAAVLAVVAIVGIVVLNIPSVKLPLALARTVNSYAGIWDDIGLNDSLAFREKDEAYTESLTVTYEGINQAVVNAMDTDVDITQLEGIGIRMDSSISLKDRRMSGSLAAIYKDEDLIKAELGVDDDTVWFSVPALLNDRYGLNTTTLGKDLIAMGVEDMDGMESLGFNFFDLIELAKTVKPSEEVTEAFEEAGKDLLKGLEIESKGSDEIKVNGERVSCSVYNVTITQDALEDYLDAIEKPLGEYIEQYMDVLFEIYESVGMPEEILTEMKEEITSSMDMDIFFDSLKNEGLDQIGDIELEVYTKGMYVMAVIWELDIDGDTMVTTLNMGGGDKYVNDFSLTIELEDYVSVEFTSTGNHTGKGGEFTDETEIKVTVDGETVGLKMESRYAPKEKEDNFSFDLSVTTPEIPAVGLEAEGQLTLGKKSVHLKLDKLAVAAASVDIVTLGIDYSIGEYTDAEEAGKIKYITKLTEDDMTKIAEDIEKNGMSWAEDLMKKIPLLEEIFAARKDPVDVYYPSDSYYG